MLLVTSEETVNRSTTERPASSPTVFQHFENGDSPAALESVVWAGFIKEGKEMELVPITS